MSPQNLAAQELVSEPTEQKQLANVYTMMLIISFIALCAAVWLLYIELQQYGDTFEWWKTSGVSAPSSASLVVPSDPFV